MHWIRIVIFRFIMLLSVSFLSIFVHAEECGNSVVVVKNSHSLIPLGDLSGENIDVINIGHSEKFFQKYCGYYDGIRSYDIDSERDIHLLKRKISSESIRLISVYSHSSWAVRAVHELSDRDKTVVVFFISYKDIAGFAGIDAGTVIVAGDDSEKLQAAAAEAVFGGESVNGRLTEDISGIGKAGDGVSITKNRLGFASPLSMGFSEGLKSRLDSIVRLNIRRHSFPGCQIVVVKDGYIVVNGSYGHLSYSSGAPKVTDATLYDVASMTKATATVAGLMLAYDRGLYQLDVPIMKYMPELIENDIGKLTPRELMHHETGMPATLNTYALMVDSASFSGKLLGYKYGKPYTVKVDKGVYGNRDARLRTDIFKKHRSEDYYAEVAKGIFGGDSMRRVISEAVYSSIPGSKKYRYSCLNFCVLKDLEERLTGDSHDLLLSKGVFEPLGAVSMRFRPADNGRIGNIAPTEKDDFMRRQIIQGFVHDEIAAYSGGVQGNAGLFSNALDVAKLCQTWLNGGLYGGIRIFSPSTVDLFVREKSGTVDRGLCFDRASRLRSMDKIGLPETTFGHTGFTGTCFWVDPENRIIVVFLCNRIYPSRDNPAFSELSPRVAILQAVYESLRR